MATLARGSGSLLAAARMGLGVWDCGCDSAAAVTANSGGGAGWASRFVVSAMSGGADEAT